jgi:hypothetical protein
VYARITHAPPVILADGESVRVVTQNGEEFIFDHVVICTPPNTTRRILSDVHMRKERELLGAFQIESSSIAIHDDPSLASVWRVVSFGLTCVCVAGFFFLFPHSLSLSHSHSHSNPQFVVDQQKQSTSKFSVFVSSQETKVIYLFDGRCVVSCVCFFVFVFLPAPTFHSVFC